MMASRAKPLSPRRTMRTRGQRLRMCVTMRASSSLAPNHVAILAGRSLDANKWRPQNT